MYWYNFLWGGGQGTRSVWEAGKDRVGSWWQKMREIIVKNYTTLHDIYQAK